MKRRARMTQDTRMRRALPSAAFGQMTVSTPSRRSARDAVAVDGKRQLERAAEAAVAALDAMILLARHVALAPRDPEIVSWPSLTLDLDVVARRGPGSSAVIDVFVGGFMDVDRRNPACGAGREPVEPLLDGQQIANRIPARKRHDR